MFVIRICSFTDYKMQLNIDAFRSIDLVNWIGVIKLFKPKINKILAENGENNDY